MEDLGWKTVPGVQLWGKFNHCFTNLIKDDWADWIEDTVSYSTAVWRWGTDATKFLRMHTLYSPLIEKLSICWRFIQFCILYGQLTFMRACKHQKRIYMYVSKLNLQTLHFMCIVWLVEQLSGSIMMPKEVQFTEVLSCQNCLNRSGVANPPIHFVLVISGAHNKRHNNLWLSSQFMINDDDDYNTG